MESQRLTREQINALTHRIKVEIDAYCIKAFDDGPRSHLGASMIGAECNRALWYSFRWVHYVVHSARMQRLFNRGHLEELRFNGYLRGIGGEIHDVDEAGKQFRVAAAQGHFGGSTDGKNQFSFPDLGFAIPPMLSEFKTSGTGAKFKELCDKGVKIAKPQHYTQMCVYGKGFGLLYALYICTNKNDDDLHVEVVELDWRVADDAVRKAEDIIAAPRPPVKLSQSPTHFVCKQCDFLGQCHEDKPYAKNCRSCVSAIPVANAEWHCKLYGQNIPKEYIAAGCDKWEAIR